MALAAEMVGISEAKTTLLKLVKNLESGEQERAILLRQNRPVAVILPMEVYERMQGIVDDLEHYADAKAIAEAERVNDGTTLSLDEVDEKLGL